MKQICILISSCKRGAAAEPDSNLAQDNGDANEAAETSMSAMGSIFSGMADMLESIRDPLYMNEYIVHRFTAFDPLKFKGMAEEFGSKRIC